LESTKLACIKLQQRSGAPDNADSPCFPSSVSDSLHSHEVDQHSLVGEEIINVVYFADWVSEIFILTILRIIKRMNIQIIKIGSAYLNQ
jgi:hypothetical protein